MKWQKRFPIKRVSLSENVFRVLLSVFLSALSENVLKRLANQHRLQKTLSIGLEIERNVLEKILKPVYLAEWLDKVNQINKY